MTVEHQSGFLKRLILRSLLLFALLSLVSDSVWALDPRQPVSSYIRTQFSTSEGLLGSVVNQIVQSKDGFLWLIVGGGLIRFDGRHFNGFRSPLHVRALAAAPDGDLWVATDHDVEQIPAANLNQFDALQAISYHPGPGAGSSILCLHFTRSGILWVGTHDGLYRFEHGTFSSIIPGMAVQKIEEASNGHLLLMTEHGFLETDGSQPVPHPDLEAQLGVKTTEVYHVFEDSYGVTWFCTANGVARRMGGSIEKLEPWGPHGHSAFRAYEDPQGTIWFAKAGGLFRSTTAGLEVVAPDMDVRYMYGDQEGDLWVGTNGHGLFRFKDRATRTFTTADGLPNNLAMTVLATRDGAIWTGFNCGGLSRFDGQHFQNYNEKNGLLNSCVWSLAEDTNGDLWIGTFGGGIFRFHEGRFTQYSKEQGVVSNIAPAVAAARDGSVWFVTPSSVGRIHNGQITNYSMAASPPIGIRTIYRDRADGIWVGTLHGLYRFAGDEFVTVPSFPRIFVYPIGEDRAGNFYLTYPENYVPGGILRIENNHPVSLTAEGKPAGMLETPHGDLWFAGISILRIPSGALDHPHLGDDPLDFEIFGPADGLATGQASEGRPDMALSHDGKLWIATTEGLVMLDLPRLPRSDQKPMIYLEEVTVGRKQQLPGHELVLPAGTNHLELNFDAIEISSPEKIRLQYRLDGMDSEWLDADPHGHAIYSTIPPGTHAFHVRACNRSGIWDRVGTVFYVIQQPYFYQTRWFLAAIIALGLLVIAGLYQLRMRHVARTLSARFEGRLAERTRIARELHDTLLQTFSASLLRFQSASKMLPARPEDAKHRVDSAIEQASNAIAEGRDAVHELRSGGPADNNLAQTIGNLGRELLSGLVGENPPGFHVQVEGTPKTLNPMVRDEAYRIAAEALRNAIMHASARRIEVEIRYDAQHLRVRIRDDGKGIDPGVLDQGHAPGHWGLRGMRERAKLAGGNLEVWSEVGSGSEIELTIPAASAYAKPASRWSVFSRSWWSKRP